MKDSRRHSSPATGQIRRLSRWHDCIFHGLYDTSLTASKYSCPVAGGLSVGICNPYQFGVTRSPNFRPMVKIPRSSLYYAGCIQPQLGILEETARSSEESCAHVSFLFQASVRQTSAVDCGPLSSQICIPPCSEIYVSAA